MVRFGKLDVTAFPHLPSGSPNATHIQWLKPNAECSNTNTQGLNLRKHVERSTRSRKSPFTKLRKSFLIGGKAKGRKMNKHRSPRFGPFSTKTWLLDKKEGKTNKNSWSCGDGVGSTIGGQWRSSLVGRFQARKRSWFIYFIVSNRACRSWDMGKSSRTKYKTYQNMTLLPETYISPENRERRKSSNGSREVPWLSGRYFFSFFGG